MKLFFIIALLFHLCLPTCSLAQKSDETVKTGFTNNSTAYSKLDDYKNFLAGIASRNAEKLDKKLRKEYNEIITEKNTGLLTELKEDNFLFESEITKYLGSIFYHILEKNNLDKNDFHFFVSRSSAVNAYTYEDGTVICNLGLLKIAETESQVAMVFCHELAHYLLDHANSSIIKRIEKFNSPEFLAQVKEIKKEKYNTKKQLEDLFVSDLFNRRRHNRVQELAADSLGMLLISKTNYGSAAIPHLFDLLNSADTLATKSSIRGFCQKENIAADENWFITRKKMSFGTDIKKEIKDTLKTHPDCALRKIYAENFFNKNPKPGPDFILSTNTRLAVIKEQSAYAEAKYAKDKERLSYYLYQLIQNDARFPQDKFIKQEILEVLLDFCLKQKAHSLAPFIDKPYATEDVNDEYAKLLKLLDALDLQKMKAITLSYYEKNKNYITLNNDLNKNLQELNKY